MTTCIYDHKNNIIAIDGRVSAGNRICTDTFDKWRIIDGEVWFFSGDVRDYQPLIDAYKSGKSEREIEAYAIIVSDGKVKDFAVLENLTVSTSLIEWNDGMGSGLEFALGALEHGTTAKQAVEYAATKDAGTGGKVSVFDVAKMEFIE